MTGNARFPRPARRSTGQALVEYAVLCGVVALIIGLSWSDPHSLPGMLIQALRTAFANFSFALSLPT